MSSTAQQQQKVIEHPPAGDDVGALVFDVGSASTRFGYAGEDCPKQLWPSVVGAPLGKGFCNGVSAKMLSMQSQQDVSVTAVTTSQQPDADVDINTSLLSPNRRGKFCGLEKRESVFSFPLDFAQKRENLSVLSCFRRHNNQLEIDCDAFETIVTRLAGPSIGLNVDLTGKPVLLTEPSRHYKPLRMKLTEVMFERFNCEAFYIAKNAVLSAFAVGRSSGCVVDIGASGTSITPVQEGFTLQRNLLQYSIGGDMLDDYLAALLAQRKHCITPFYAVKKKVTDYNRGVDATNVVDLESVDPTYLYYSKRYVLRSLKELICRCSLDDHRDPSMTTATTAATAAAGGSGAMRYELPDGTVLADAEQLGAMTASLLFNPRPLLETPSIQFVDEFPGLPKAIVSCINGCDTDIRRDLFGSVVIVGGVAMIPGLADKVARVTQERAPSMPTKIKFVAPSSMPERQFSSWLGGSILASLSTFQQMWFSKAEYEEHGASLVERKCRQ